MTQENRKLLIKAKEGKLLYLNGIITKKELNDYMNPYIKRFNEISIEKAKKYNMKPQKVSVSSLLKSRFF